MPLMPIVMLLIILAPPAALDLGPARPPTLTSMLPRPGEDPPMSQPLSQPASAGSPVCSAGCTLSRVLSLAKDRPEVVSKPVLSKVEGPVLSPVEGGQSGANTLPVTFASG